VVTGGDRRNQKLPIRRLQEEQLATYLLGETRTRLVAAPPRTFGYLLDRKFRRINMLPGPRCLRVKPDVVIAILSPRTFGQGQESLGTMGIQVFTAGDQLQGVTRMV